jgi:hypothetical protein
VTGAAAWLTVEVTGAALATVDAACDTVAEAWLTVELTGEATELPAEPAVELPAEPAGAVTLETTPLTVLVTPVTVLVTAPSRPPPEPEADGVDDAGVARLVVAAWALEPDRSQQMAIRPRQQLASIRARSAIRPARLWPAATHASGTAYSTPLQPP